VNIKCDLLSQKKEQLKYSLKRKFIDTFIASLGLVSTSLFSFMAFLSVGLVVIQNYDSQAILKAETFGLTGFVALIFLYIGSTILPVFIGFKVFSGTTISICAVCFGIVSYSGFILNLKNLSNPFLIIVIGVLIGWIGEFISAVGLVIVYSFWKSIGVFLTLIFESLLSLLFIDLMSNQKGVTNIDVLFSFAGVFLNLLSTFLIFQKTIREEQNFAWFREQAIFFSTILGVSFYKDDLTDQNFEDLDLGHTDFRETKIYHTSFRGAKNLEFARLDGTILANPKTRKLLTTAKGIEPLDKNLSHINLKGADLSDLNLEGVDFTGANLTDVDFTGANLIGANFTNAQLFNTNFSNACLTESCICDWAINHQTCFENVECDWVYLRRGKFGSSEKKPDIDKFQSGEFQKWIRQLQDTVDLILREPPNVRALVKAIENTANKYGGLDPARFSIESKGDNLYVARVGTTPDADKAQIASSIVVNYNAINELTIHGESNRILLNPTGEYMENQNQNISAGGSIDMSSGTRVNVGGNIIGSSITLGDLNGQVSNIIQSLGDIQTNDGQNIADIFAALQTTINDDNLLPKEQKIQAMEAVATLAEEAQKPKEQRFLKLCTLAVNALKGIVSTVTDVSKIAEVLKTHLPTLVKFFGI
jgi:uncharacterized protein YjbI with pentapeptide repeats